MNQERVVCGRCGKTRFSPPVSVIVLFTPGMLRPYPLIPDEDYTVCIGCEGAVYALIDAAASAHPRTRVAGPWTKAIVVFIDGHAVELKPARAAPALA